MSRIHENCGLKKLKTIALKYRYILSGHKIYRTKQSLLKVIVLYSSWRIFTSNSNCLYCSSSTDALQLMTKLYQPYESLYADNKVSCKLLINIISTFTIVNIKHNYSREKRTFRKENLLISRYVKLAERITVIVQ